MTRSNSLEATIRHISASGKGILAADESTPTISKRFLACNIESTEATRLAYREMLITTPGINQYIAGIILFEETLNQKTSQGVPFAEALNQLDILPGIKVDKGLVDLASTDHEQVTQGLDGLRERLVDYYNKGARFAKWRATYAISSSANTPSTLAIKTNAEVLARYAALCQEVGLVPIVEPEVLIDGTHTLAECEKASAAVFYAVFKALHRHKVALEHIILKPSMVISGKTCSELASKEAVADATLRILRRTVPAAVPTINFLSGGQTSEQATAHLNLMNQMKRIPWHISFSYARALQDHAMKIWQGKRENIQAAQAAFYKRAKLNSLASRGQYMESMEKEEASIA